MTLKEIAALANVSISTVSRVLNSPDNSFATEAVRNRVWSIVKQTGYTPNVAAKRLRAGKSERSDGNFKTISCVFTRTKTLGDNPFFAQLARAIEHHALQLGYVTTASFSIFDLNDMNIRQKISSSEVDGIIALGRCDEATCKFFEEHYKNVVYTGLNKVDAEWDQVICDGYKAAEKAMEHLINYGHKRIAYIGETENEVRYEAYKNMLLEAGLPFEPVYVSNCMQNSAGGYAGAQAMLEKVSELPTAVFCANDITAIGAVKYFTEQGYKIPEHFSLISIDNIDIAQYISPMLTTINVPVVELGNIAVRVLIDRIMKGHKIPIEVIVPSKLVVRETTAKPGKQKTLG